MFYLTIRLAIDITDENGCTGLQRASANGQVSKMIFIKMIEWIRKNILREFIYSLYFFILNRLR